MDKMQGKAAEKEKDNGGGQDSPVKKMMQKKGDIGRRVVTESKMEEPQKEFQMEGIDSFL